MILGVEGFVMLHAERPGECGTDVEAMLASDLGDTPHLGYAYEAASRTLWLTFDPRPLPCFTLELMDSVLRLQGAVRRMWGSDTPNPGQVIRFVVLRSAHPGVFNTGGDLGLFLSYIESGDVDGLRTYGECATRACHGMLDGFGASLLTICLVQGKALGGGFEVSRCCDFLVAEESSSFHLPEIKFSMFPGNGAMSVLSHRMGRGLLQRMIFQGAALAARSALEADVVDSLAEDGKGEEAVRALIAEATPRHAATVAFCRGMHEANGVSLERMLAETDRWARSSAVLAKEDLDIMRRLVAAQNKRFARRAAKQEH